MVKRRILLFCLAAWIGWSLGHLGTVSKREEPKRRMPWEPTVEQEAYRKLQRGIGGLKSEYEESRALVSQFVLPHRRFASRPPPSSGNNAVDFSRGYEVDSDPSGWDAETGGAADSQYSRFSTAQAHSGTHAAELLNTETGTRYQAFDMGTAKSGLSLCFWFRTPAAAGADDLFRNMVLSSTSDPGDVVIGTYYQEDAGSQFLRLRGTTFPAGATDLAVSTWHRLEVVFVQGGTCSLKIYNEAGTQIGSTITVTADNTGVRWVLIGRMSATGAATFGACYFDDLGGDFTDSTSPLWPFTVAN